MDEPDDNKLKPADDEREVESEEKQRGEEIEVDEDRLPSRAMAIHEHIRQEGEKEMERDALALLWSAIAAGLSMGASLLAKGIFHVKLEGIPGGFLLENLGYTFGFIIVIMARQQLFTENTVTAVLPVMHNPTPRKRRFTHAAMVCGAGGQSHRHRGGRMGLQLYACF